MACVSSLTRNRGSHSALILESNLNELPPSCSFRYKIELPAQAFVDIYELALQQPYTSGVSSTGSCSNLELPATSNDCHQVIYITLEGNHRIEMPIHARYPIPHQYNNEIPISFSLPNIQRTCLNNTESMHIPGFLSSGCLFCMNLLHIRYSFRVLKHIESVFDRRILDYASTISWNLFIQSDRVFYTSSYIHLLLPHGLSNFVDSLFLELIREHQPFKINSEVRF